MPMPTLFLPGFSACTHLICKYESCSAKVSYLKQNSKIISKFFLCRACLFFVSYFFLPFHALSLSLASRPMSLYICSLVTTYQFIAY